MLLGAGLVHPLGRGLFLWDINTLIEHGHQTGSLSERNGVRKKVDPFIVLSGHRQKQGHYANHKVPNSPSAQLMGETVVYLVQF